MPDTLRASPHHAVSRSGETLEGFARAFFVPHRSQDWKFGSGLEKLPLLVAATPRRMLLFEVTLLTVHRYCFIPYDEIEYLQPSKPGIGIAPRFGSSPAPHSSTPRAAA